jgi:hypothetical protein
MPLNNPMDRKLLHYNAEKAGIKVSTLKNKPCKFSKGSKNTMLPIQGIVTLGIKVWGEE